MVVQSDKEPDKRDTKRTDEANDTDDLNPEKRPKGRTGRRPQLTVLVEGITKAGQILGLSDRAINALVLTSMGDELLVGGKSGRTIADAIEMAQKALSEAGLHISTDECIMYLVDPDRAAQDIRSELQADVQRKPPKRHVKVTDDQRRQARHHTYRGRNKD